MIKQELRIEGIPAILRGNKSDKLFIAIHGNLSNKADDVIVILAEEATARGYQVISFDLPQHGERKEENYACKEGTRNENFNIFSQGFRNVGI